MSVKLMKHEGGIYTLYSKQTIKADIASVWNFFSQPKNLSNLTPDDLDFKITSGNSERFYEGKIISYRIKLLHFLNFSWTSEITKVKENNYFIDKQLFGPYKLWHHEHHFKDNKDGTITIIDRVKYKLYFYPISKMIHQLFVKRNLIRIFSFRREKIKEIYSIKLYP